MLLAASDRKLIHRGGRRRRLQGSGLLMTNTTPCQTGRLFILACEFPPAVVNVVNTVRYWNGTGATVSIVVGVVDGHANFSRTTRSAGRRTQQSAQAIRMGSVGIVGGIVGDTG